MGFVEGLARPLVRWSAGPLVPGPLVLWSAGPLVLGSLVLVPVARLFSGSPIRWCPGPLVTWSSGPPVLGFSGPWVLVVLARWFSLVLWLTPSLLARFSGPSVPWCPVLGSRLASLFLVPWSCGFPGLPSSLAR